MQSLIGYATLNIALQVGLYIWITLAREPEELELRKRVFFITFLSLLVFRLVLAALKPFA